MLPRMFYLAGEWRSSSDTYFVKNPYNQETVACVARASAQDIDEAVRRASETFEVMRSLPAFKRAAALTQIRDGLIQRREELARAIVLEAGKPIRDARTEVDRAILVFTIAIEECKRLEGDVLPLDVTAAAERRFAITRRFPLGVSCWSRRCSRIQLGT